MAFKAASRRARLSVEQDHSMPARKCREAWLWQATVRVDRHLRAGDRMDRNRKVAQECR